MPRSDGSTDRRYRVGPGDLGGLPGDFVRTILSLFGSAGDSWLGSLPEIIASCESRWDLTALPPFPELTFNYIAPATRRDGSSVVLKLGPPGADVNPEYTTEMEALVRFAGRACVRLLAVDRDAGALLLERAVPGDTLAVGSNDDAATRVAARLMQRLRRPISLPHPFPTTTDWGQGFAAIRARFDGQTGPLPARLVATAEGLFAELTASSAEPVLLHGDLHHWNILRASREPWLAIDPKGVVGEPAYEVGALLRNVPASLQGDADLASLTRRRLDILAETLSFDRERLRCWGLSQAVLSAWWDIEDGTGTGAWVIRVARALEDARA